MDYLKIDKNEERRRYQITVGATIVPAAYAGGDDDSGDGNKQKAEDYSAAARDDCDENDVKQAGFDCFGIAVNDIEADISGLP